MVSLHPMAPKKRESLGSEDRSPGGGTLGPGTEGGEEGPLGSV